MNEQVIKEIAVSLNIKNNQVINTLSLLGEGNTIPFIARYRKEATNGLDETQIKQISDVYLYQVNLLKRKEDVIRLIEEKDLMTDDLREKILKSEKLVDVEDLYRPYKEKKKTKASLAIANGLEGLAKIIMTFPLGISLEEISSSFHSDKVSDVNEKLLGAKYIIAELISDDASYRKWIRNFVFRNGSIVSKLKKKAEDENKVYEMYYEYNELISKVKPHRILAINRGENEDVLSIAIDSNTSEIHAYLSSKLIKNNLSNCKDFVSEAISDSIKRLIYPSIEREIRSDLTDFASKSAISNFGENAKKLLLTPPMKEITVLGFDPAFRTGCKLAVLDKMGNSIDISVIYPHEPKNEKEKSKKHVLDLIEKYKIDVIAIGNGTASRESEAFVAELLKECKYDTKYIIVNEAGASVYSASKLAIEEFPDLDVSERSAISIGRRLQDPLSELVKIDPKSIGVGLYQHDVKTKELDDTLTFVVSNVVNSVGVNINTASSSILSYISGLSKKNIEALLNKKNEIGKFVSRAEIKKTKGLSDKAYQQAIGFIRVIDGKNSLDKTSIHPESYSAANIILKELGCTDKDLGTKKIFDAIEKIDINKIKELVLVDEYTLNDIITSLKKPIIDPREELSAPILKSDILTLEDLKKGMELQGTVRNVVDFGAFIDIGLKNDGLVHISQMKNGYIKHPSEILSVGDIITCFVLDINEEKKKVSLTLLKEKL